MMEDFKNVSDPERLRACIEYAVRAYQELAAKFMFQNDQMLSQLAHAETLRLEHDEHRAHVKRLNMEIINLYRELGQKYEIGDINIVELIPPNGQQLYFEFDENFVIGIQ